MSGEASIASLVQKQLSDTRQEQRRKGAQEVADQCKKIFVDIAPPDSYRQIEAVLRSVDAALLRNSQAAARRGGLLSIASVARALPAKVDHDEAFVACVLGQVLPFFKDNDLSVRLSAVEAAVNVVSVFRAQTLRTSFTDLFRAMLCAIADREPKVQSACTELSNVVKEIANELSAGLQSPASAGEPTAGEPVGISEFPIDRFVAFVQEGLQAASPEGISFVLQWLDVADSVPGRRIVLQVGSFLGRLFALVSATYPTVAQATEGTLRRYYEEVKQVHKELNIVSMMMTALNFASNAKPRTREVACDWILLLLELGQERVLPIAHVIVKTAVIGVSDTEIKVKALANTISDRLGELLTRLTRAEAAASVSPCAVPLQPPPTSKSEESVASNTSAAATEPVVVSPTPTSSVQYDALLEGLRSAVEQPEPSRVLLLMWVSLVHRLSPDTVRAQRDNLFPALLAMLRDHGAVLETVIEVLTQISGDDYFTAFITSLIGELASGPPELLAKAPIIFKRLQVLYMGPGNADCLPGATAFPTCEKLFLQAAAVLQRNPNKQFAARLVTTLHYMLLTAEELQPFREVLKGGAENPRAVAAFLALYPCWCFNPVAAIALCLLTKAYDHAHRLVVTLGNGECSSHTLVQLDRLVQLLESPVFAFLRLALLSPRENASLVRALFGVQMILPQSSAQFRLLHHRLKSVTAVSLVGDDPSSPASQKKKEGENGNRVDWAVLLQQYEEAQRSLIVFEQLQAAQRER